MNRLVKRSGLFIPVCLLAAVLALVTAGTSSGAQAQRQVPTLKEVLAQGGDFGALLSKSGDALRAELMAKHRGGYYGPYAEVRRDMKVEDNVFMGHKWYRIATKKGVRAEGTKKILYLHGGAWILEASPRYMAFVSFLADSSGAEVWFPEYPLAPEHNAVQAFEMLSGLYGEMLKEAPAHEIAVMGDSTGGSLALGLGMYLRDHGVPQPNNLILFSPGVDIMLWRTPEEVAYNRKLVEAGLNAVSSNAQSTIMDWWRGDLPETDYRVNSTFGDMRGLAPMTVFVGSAENESIMKFVAKAAEQRVPVKYWEKMNAPHVWVTLEGPESERERAFVVDLLKNPVDPVSSGRTSAQETAHGGRKVTAGRDRWGDFAPKFAELNDDVLFGQVWARTDELSPRDRSLITVSGLMGSNMLTDAFKGHLRAAKAHGVTKDEMVELITHLAFYTGWPKAWAALPMVKEIYGDEAN